MARLREEILDFALIRKHAFRFSRMVVTMRQEYNDLKVRAEPADSQLKLV